MRARICGSISSGSTACSRPTSVSRKGFDFDWLTHSGCERTSTSQFQKATATTSSRMPRAAPNRKPRVRSSAPMRLSMMKSAIRDVMKEMMISATRKMMPADPAIAMRSSVV